MKRCAAVLVLVFGVLLVAPGHADAQPPPVATSSEALVDGLGHETFTVTLDDGAVASGNLVRVTRGPTLRVEPVHATGTIAGTQPTSTMADAELPRGGLATVNGGFWLSAAGGKPHGVAATDRKLFTGPKTQWGKPGHRGTLGIRSDGGAVFSRLHGRLRLLRDGQDPATINDLNYLPLKVGGSGAGELLAYTPAWGRTVEAPQGSVVAVLRGLTLPLMGTATATVSAVEATSGAIDIPSGGAVLIGYGRATKRLDGLAVGGTAQIEVDIAPLDVTADAWVSSVDVLPGGPLIVRDGQMTPPDDWVAEGFSHERHNAPRHPRTAIAQTADGTVLLVTVDGRQAHSVGMTMWELAQLLLDLGATDGLSLDGGGSTTLTVLGKVRNRFSDPTERPVANALTVRYLPEVTVRDPATTACPSTRVPDPGFADVAGRPHEQTIACLAWYGITSGTAPSTYAPATIVTRAQMASFLARMVDYVADHTGTGDPGHVLPTGATATFTDVRANSAHAPAIARLAAAGIISGGPGDLPASKFGPRQAITRAQMATLLDRTVTFVRQRALRDGGNVFADDTAVIHEAAINRLAAAGIAQGRSPGLFGPRRAVRRGAMASFLQRTMEVLAAGGTTRPPG
ncbi:hypothetical protein BH23ACT10_BH23ACT10_24410 [soil metagenome]